MGTHDATRHYELPRTGLEPLKGFPEVCELLGVSRWTLYRLIRDGALAPIRVGDRLKFAPDELRAYLDRNREG